ncbi:MAG: phospho-2-dehydro-3-deoxyheptonate aldolase, partial [Spirochaetaceae bacterium]|nr:phospho-2-dehydro-3-deoxyheptonate aldolase [Spirochaetaceae bacterium]
MIIVLKNGISDPDKDRLTSFLSEKGFRIREVVGENETVVGAVGSVSIDYREVEILPGVDRVIPISKPYKMASRELHPQDSVVSIGRVKIGGSRIVTIAGPCAVESRQQILDVAWAVREAG